MAVLITAEMLHEYARTSPTILNKFLEEALKNPDSEVGVLVRNPEVLEKIMDGVREDLESRIKDVNHRIREIGRRKVFAAAAVGITTWLFEGAIKIDKTGQPVTPKSKKPASDSEALQITVNMLKSLILPTLIGLGGYAVASEIAQGWEDKLGEKLALLKAEINQLGKKEQQAKAAETTQTMRR